MKIRSIGSLAGWAAAAAVVFHGEVTTEQQEILNHMSIVYLDDGTGGLVKCFVDRIAEDHTRGDLKCPSCGQEFARLATIRGRPAHKIIQGKIFTRGMRRK